MFELTLTLRCNQRYFLLPRLCAAVLIVGALLLPQGGIRADAQVAQAPVSPHAVPAALLAGVAQVAAGDGFTCVRMEAAQGGGLKCWGRNASGRLGDGTTEDRRLPVDVVGLTSGVSEVAAGRTHVCALTAGGGVKCWGGNAHGQLGDATLTDRSTPVDVVGLMSGVAAIAAGDEHTCALTTGGGVKCWGENWDGRLGDGTTESHSTPVNVAGLTNGVSAIAVGLTHTCALTTGGGAKCWGDNQYGQLGDATRENRNAAVDVTGLTSGISAVATGQTHTCALTAGGGVKCWGDNRMGQLGDGESGHLLQRSTPVDVIELTAPVAAITAGGGQTCARMMTGGAKCWGGNQYGQLGDGTIQNRSTPVDVTGLASVNAIVAGADDTCAVTPGGGVKCWGDNRDGQLGEGTRVLQRSTPLTVAGLGDAVTALTGGSFHTCALTAGGAVKCWGQNLHGELGDGTAIQSSSPVDVTGLTNGITAIAAGGLHTCALTTSGGVKCWGGVPTDVAGLTDVTAIATSGGHACALTADAGVKCWGENGSGQLGDGTIEYRSTPVSVSGLGNQVTAIATGAAHTCALTTGGGGKCWGRNSDGQLGIGAAGDRTTPADVVGLAGGVSAIAAGGDHTCALTVGGGIKCWGYNALGAVGDGTTESRNTPVNVAGLTRDMAALALGRDHTCALTASGGIKCWGWNGYSQLGDGTRANRTTPVDVIGLSGGVTSVATGEYQTCAVLSNGEARCWGDDFYGQLGTSSVLERHTPADAVASVTPALAINYATGSPGSTFTVSGWDFPPGATVTATTNRTSRSLTLPVSVTGSFIFFLDTEGGAAGDGQVTVGVNPKRNPQATVSFALSGGAPLRLIEGGGATLILWGRSVYQPLIKR